MNYSTIVISIADNKYGKSKPQEDSFKTSGNIFCVADGITRDPLGPINFGNLPMEELLKNYPNPSPAKMAADCFCNNFAAFLKDKVVDDKTIKEAFVDSNKHIKELNDKLNPNPDYLVNDFYSCVAVGGVIQKDKLYWASIGDCQVMVLDRNGNIKFESPNGLDNFIRYIKKRQERWSNPERRKEIRSQYRNNPNMIIDGKLVSYGALTGEETAETFINFGTQNLSKGDKIIFYSDGFAKALQNLKFRQSLVSNSKEKPLELDERMAQNDYESYGKERTLILVNL